MAILCPDYKLLFVMVPATGCSVVGNLLQSDFGGQWLPEKDIVQHGRMVLNRKHNSVPQLLEHGVVTREQLDDLLVVATVRNPFDRYVTYYQRLVGAWTDEYLDWTSRDLERKRAGLTEVEYAALVASRERTVRRIRRRQAIVRRVGFNNWLKASLLRWRLRSARKKGTSPRSDYVFPMLAGVDVAIRFEQLEVGLNEVLRRVGASQNATLPRKNVTHGKQPYAEYYSGSTRLFAEAMLKDELRRFGYRFDGPTMSGNVIELQRKNWQEPLDTTAITTG